MKFFKSKTFIFLVIIVIAVILLLPSDDTKTTSLTDFPPLDLPEKQPAPASRDTFPTGPKGTSKILEPGWTDPIKLGFNDAGWEDSPYITRDGSQILLYWSPVPNLADPAVIDKATEKIVSDPEMARKTGLDGNIYVSSRPFTSKSIHPISKDKGEFAYSDACPYLSKSGDLYYCSTKESWVQGKGVIPTNYVNGKRLDFGTGTNEGNFHLVDSLDEGWGGCPSDENICVMKKAKGSNFTNEFKLAPFPINSRDIEGVQDFQPYLTDDGKTLYFTSNRDGVFFNIYKSTRLDKEGLEWSTPVKFIEGLGGGAAELSMTADGKELIYAELFWRDDGSPGLDIFYSRKK